MKGIPVLIVLLCVLRALIHGESTEQSVVVSPRITIEGQPDYSDLGRFVDFFENKGLNGQALAIALWQHLSGF